ncbi:CRAL/TRIO domain-containing protein [Phthorimaea operculella]|nr:CRAL/TRIO domain-containing protein [Phthorimaea operculella]
MEVLPKDSILKFHPDTLKNVRKSFNLDEARIKESIDLLEDWIEKQHHFTKKDFDRDYLERVLIAAKGSVERAKERIDKSCTYRNLLPQYFEDFDVEEATKNSFGKMDAAMLPRMTDNNVRYYVCVHHGDKFSAEMFFNAFKYIQLEYVRAYDYASAYEVILDYRFSKVTEVVSSVNLMDLRDLVSIGTEGYGVRVTGIHMISDSRFVDLLLSVAKQIVPAKLSRRITLHKNLESLHQMVQKDVLPSELGGKEKKMPDLFAEWVDVLNAQGFRQYWRDMNAAKTDESSRRSDTYNDKYMGMPGSFRMLTVD